MSRILRPTWPGVSVAMPTPGSKSYSPPIKSWPRTPASARRGSRLDYQRGLPKRALPSVGSHEDDVVAPADAQVDRALRHLILEWREPVAHMFRLRQYVEDECDRSVELSSGENLELAREFDD